MSNNPRLVVAMTGASGAYVARLLLSKSPWPTILIASRWAQEIYARECGPFDEVAQLAGEVYDADNLAAPPASGSVPTAGMVIAPCSINTLGQIAAGLADTLISRAAHCHLKERRPLILAIRESPLTTINLENALKVAAAGAILMPLTPPYFMFQGKRADQITLHELMDAYVDRLLALLGRQMAATWEDLR
ncbi:UbiX family flavin prenyltransferase [Desulfatitalea tepidiphila]|uniref:UbiX family flavin prenyltransferase n=1 Tax=Desulfatitalea tepidiphila TaxID=1185843 RepID=UPI0006B5C5F8|nr:UbiX family flavin prenyltransferase [Desulfatitalea tepidiphila]